jgi:polysaccharide deacetylase 2 family uncharacterized protein YibQ
VTFYATSGMARRKRKGRKRNKGRGGFFIAILLLGLLLLVALLWWPQPDKKVSHKGRPFVSREVPRLALIIDDGGYNIEVLREILKTGRPLTLAILPESPHAREAAQWAHRGGAEVMLHLPMEPKEGQPAQLEKDTILAGMSEERVQKIFREGRQHVPYARGVNNHMGSKATEDPEVMGTLMRILREEHLYFIDSHTSAHTVGPRMAREAGVPYAQNEKFIDLGKNLPEIKEALRSAMAKAKQEGKAVAIGHPQLLTARAIREMIPEIENEGIRLVFASEVVQ